MQLSEKIRIIRKARGITAQEELGDRLSLVSKDGISRQSVSDWENGKTEPKLDNVRDLARVLDVSFDALLDDTIDLNDKEVLQSVLNHSTPTSTQPIRNKVKYTLYVSTVSVKSYVYLIIAGIALILTLIFGTLSIVFDWTTAIIYVFAVGGSIVIVFTPVSINELIRIKRGLVRAYVGEMNNTYLIIDMYKQARNTLYIAIDQIEKIELCGKQTKNYGDVKIWVKGRSRAINVYKLQHPQKFIDIYQKLLQDPEAQERL